MRKYPYIAAAEAGTIIAASGTATITINASGAEGANKRPTVDIEAYNGGPLRVAGYYRPVVVDLKGLRARATTPILLDHDHTQIVGQGKATIGDRGVTIAGTITGDDAPAQRVTSHAANGFVWAASVGVQPDRVEFLDAGKSINVNGQTFHGPLNIVRAGRLGEVSIVAVGADESATARIAATAAGVDFMNFAEWLKARGLELDKLTPEAKATLEAAYKADGAAGTPAPAPAPAGTPAPVAASGTPAPSPEATVEAMRATIAAESERIAAVRAACTLNGKHFADIEAKAIKENWSKDKTELEVLRASRPTTPMAGFSLTAPGVTQTVLLAAALLSAKLDKPEAHCDAPSLEAAGKLFKRGISLQELMIEAAWANGYSGRSFRSDMVGVQNAAFGRVNASGFSTVNIGDILSNVANKFLLSGFFSVEGTWRNICAVRNVSDFKTVTSYRLIGTDQYEVVAPGGELKHGTLGNDSFTNKADTYGLMLTIDRRDIINDDLGAITTVPRKLGRGSGLKINDVFWAAFMNNASFFTSGNGNYISGSDTVLGVDGLTKGVVAFDSMVDSDGKPTGVKPAILLVPTALSVNAALLNSAMEVRDTTASTKYPTANPHKGQYRPESSRYLANSSYTGNSSTAWYLLADPADLAVVEVAFLNGQESPTIETAEAEFNVLGVQMRGYHDFGVALQDPKAGVKSKGAA